MLETLRSASKSWVAAILIGLLIISFAVWGINDIFAGGSSTTIARVGDSEIDVRSFESDYMMRVRRQTDANGQPLTPEQGRLVGYDRVVLEQMISDLAVRLEAQRLGITASDAMVRGALADIPGLAKPDGSIDPMMFDRLLQSVQMSEAVFVQLIRQDLMRAQLMQTARLGGRPPAGMVRMLQAHANERRVIDYVVLTADKAGEIAVPDDATLQAYVQANAARYTTPELRGVTILSVGPSDLMPSIAVTDEEIQNEYEVQKQRFETPETRELQQITYPSKEAAEAARASLDSGKTFDDLAKEQNLKPEDIALGTLQKGDVSVPAAAFETAEGQITPAVQGPFGWVLIRVVKITAGKTTPLDEVKTQIRDEIAHTKALDQVASLSPQVQEVMSASDQLEDAARELKLQLRTVPALDAEGRDGDGKPVEGLPDGAAFLEDVFSLDQGEQSFLAETPEHVLYVVRVDKISAPALKPLNAMRDAVAATWLEEQQFAKLKALADDAAAKGASDIATMASNLGLEAKTSPALDRNTANEDISSAFLTTLFDNPKGKWLAGPGTKAPQMIVAQVKEITSETPANETEQLQNIGLRLNQGVSDDLEETYRQAILAATPIEIDEAMFERTRRPAQ